MKPNLDSEDHAEEPEGANHAHLSPLLVLGEGHQDQVVAIYNPP